jgi:2-(1,2-epoxy-1,2-dihydrophenyl)acetyl-CoA isomerase
MSEATPAESPQDPLLSRLDESVLVLTLNRPSVRNAINLAMVEALARELEQAESNPEVRCVVLTGSGNAFCSGGDLRSMGGAAAAGKVPDASSAIETLRRTQRATALRLHRSSKPTLAALPGAAVGAGFSWALACDLRIMADTATLQTGFARLALAGDHGGLYFLNRLVGPAKAVELYLLSPTIGAGEALALGLVNWTCPAAELSTRAMDIARELADGPPLAQRFIKENLAAAHTAPDVAAYLDEEAARQIAAMQTEDFGEAIHARQQQRTPRFSGK